MTRPKAVSYAQVHEAVRKILARKRRIHCFLCGGEIEIQLQHCTREPNTTAIGPERPRAPELQIGADEWYEVSALVCSRCGTEIEPYEEVRLLNTNVRFGSLTFLEPYLGRDGQRKMRTPKEVDWERRWKRSRWPAGVSKFHQKVQRWLTQNFRTCPNCGGPIDYRSDSRFGKIETVYYDPNPGAIAMRLPPEPRMYDVVVSIFCVGRCRQKFAIPAEIEALNKAVEEEARQTHRAPRPLPDSEKRPSRLSPRRKVVRISRIEDLECKCPEYCPRHSRIRIAVR